MKMARGRRTALVTGTLVIAAVALTAIFGRGAIVERWYIHRLHSEDESSRVAAARKLADMTSLAAVPYLIQAIKAESKERAGLVIYEFGPHNYGHLLTPLSYALYRIGIASRYPGKKALLEKI